MPKKSERKIIAGLDIGTSKVAAIIGEISPHGDLDIIGVGSHPSRGLKKGVVVNIDSTVQAIHEAVKEAEYMAGCEIDSVYTGIAGSHIHSFNSHGVVPIRGDAVSSEDVDHVIDAARAVLIPADQKILHVLPQEFMVDKQTGIHEPIGMTGVRLEADVHMVTASVVATQNIVTCIRRCGLNVEDIILEQLASSAAVLTEDEKQLGVCLVDIGGGTTDIAVFYQGSILHTAVISVAGDQVTNDIAVALRAPTQDAETIKIQYARACAHLADPNEMLDIPTIGDREHKKVSCLTLSEVVEPRFEELFSLIQAELRFHHLEGLLDSGVVLTGGSAKMTGVVELAENIFQLPVRLGVPRHISGLVDVVHNPIYATGVGLLQYGYQTRMQHQHHMETHTGRHLKVLVGRVKQWFQGNF